MSQLALIVGAGIGGLSAAIALRQAGWQVRIFERRPSASELGFGVALAPNAVAALRNLGVADVVIARSFEPTGGEVRRMDGTVLKRVVLPTGALGGLTLVALRPALHGALLEAAGSDTISLNCTATGFVDRGDRVTLQLANGQSVDGDLLIGADGIGSVIRRAIHPGEKPPRSAGIVAVRGAVHEGLQHLGRHFAVYYMGRGLESVFVRASDTGIYWFVSLAREMVPEGMRDPRAIISLMSPMFDDAFRAVTTATTDLRCDELVDRDPLPFWGKGRVTLLGDAAHPVLPHTGQGAAQAITDAVVLAQALAAHPDPVSALRAYEAERLPKTAALLGQGRRTARVMRMTNPVGCAMRELALRVLPIQTMAKVFIRINRRAGTDVS